MVPAALRKLGLLAGLTAAGSLSLNAYVPLLPEVQHYFHVSLPQVQSTVSYALIAYAVCMLLAGQLIDRLGHRAAVLMGMGAYALGALMCLLGSSIEWLVLGRVVLSAGAAIGYIGGRAICAEIYPAEQLRRALAHLMMISVMIPLFAPFIGSLLSELHGWRTMFEFLFAYGVLWSLLIWKNLPEVTAHPKYKEHVIGAASVTRREALLRASYLVPVSMYVLLYLPYIVFASLAPHLLEHYYQRSANTYAQLFPLLIVAYFVGNYLVSRWGNHLGVAWLLRCSLITVIAGFVLAFGLLWLGWRQPLAIFLPYTTLSFGHGLALPTLSIQAVDASRPHTATGWSLLGFTQQALGGVCVQLMGLTDASSPYPVLLFGAGATVLFAALYLWGWHAE